MQTKTKKDIGNIMTGTIYLNIRYQTERNYTEKSAEKIGLITLRIYKLLKIINMADKKLSSVSAVSDMNFVYAETSTGETVKISKADLASVVAGLLSIPSGKRAFSYKESFSNNGTVSINIGKVRGLIYVKCGSLNGDNIKCFMAKSSAVEVVGSAIDSPFDSGITASMSSGSVTVTAKNPSGSGFINLDVWYFN